MLPDNIKKIAVLRANAVGDFIVTLPALQSIRQKYPDAEMVVLGKPWHKSYLEESDEGEKRTCIDRVLVLPVMKGLREEKGQNEDPAEIEKFAEEAARENFDIILNFQGRGIAANPFIKKLKPKFSAGHCCEASIPLDCSLEYYYYQSEPARYLELAYAIGAQPSTLEPQINILKKDHEEADRFLNKYNIKNFVAIQPAGNEPRRMWSGKKFSLLADLISKEGFSVVFTGSEPEGGLIERIQSDMKYRSYNSAGDLSLGGLGALQSRSALVISVDTGPLHIACAVGAKTVGLYWAPNLINWAPLTRKNHRPVISWKMDCPGCGISPNIPYPFEPMTNSCDHSFSFIDNISVEDVIKEAALLLKNQGASVK